MFVMLFLLITLVFIFIAGVVIYRISSNIEANDFDTVVYKGRLYVKGRKIGRSVQLLDFTSSRGLKSFFVDEDELR